MTHYDTTMVVLCTGGDILLLFTGDGSALLLFGRPDTCPWGTRIRN